MWIACVHEENKCMSCPNLVEFALGLCEQICTPMRVRRQRQRGWWCFRIRRWCCLSQMEREWEWERRESHEWKCETNRRGRREWDCVLESDCVRNKVGENACTSQWLSSIHKYKQRKERTCVMKSTQREREWEVSN